MVPLNTIDADSHSALDVILADYLKAVEVGQPPDRGEMLARHGELADELAEFFAGFDQFDQFAAPLRAVRQSAVSSIQEGATLARCAVDTVSDPRQTAPYHPPPLSTKSANPSDPALAGTIPGYETLGVLGRGGMGVVYKARQVQLKRLVALKMIRAGDQADEAEVARFRVEAEAVARLQHPNIVQIYEVGEHRGQPYCSLEFVEGGTLAARLAGTPQPPREAALLARTLAQAMDAAHQRGIVHRDLKPGNILLARDGSPKITDFGLAKKIDEDVGQTRTGAIMGTPAYMAPEQAAGAKDVGPLADVYALGVILYEMLTGRPPFRAASMLETLEQVRSREPVAVRLLQPKVPRDLETICLKCLHKEPKKRFASAAALADDLERWLDGKPIQARRSRLWERAYRWVRRNPLVASLTALVVVAIVGGFAGVVLQWRQTKAALNRAESSLYIQRVSLADREIRAGNADRADVLLELCPVSLRHWEWHYLKRRSHANWLRLVGHSDLVRCVTYSADGKRLASSGNDGTVRIWDSATGQERLTLRGNESWVSSVGFHADGRRLVSTSANGTIMVWDSVDGRRLSSVNHGFSLMKLSPDSRLFALLKGDGLTVHELGSGRETTRIPGRNASHNEAIAFSPDSSRITALLNGCLRIWDTRTGQEIHLLDRTLSRGIYSLLYSPDGLRLFATCPEERFTGLKVWDAQTGKVVAESLSTPLTVCAMALSNDGEKIATGGHEGVVKIRHAKTGKNLHALRTFTDAILSLAFRPDSQSLAVATGRDIWLRVWGEQQDQGPLSLRSHADGVASVAYSPDGSLLASCGDNDRIRVWNAGTGQLVSEFTAPQTGASNVAFSPEGQRLLAVSRDGIIHTWHTASGQLGLSLRVKNSKLLDAIFSPDSQRIASAGSDRSVHVWDVATGNEVLTCVGHEAEVLCVRYSPDGRRLASAGSDGSVRIWDGTTGREVSTLRGHQSHVQGIAFHPNGLLVASASTDETVRLWEIDTGKEVKLQGHTGPVRGLSFSPDGRRLASASEDGTVRLWDVTTGQEALSLPDAGKVRWVSFSPDGRALATASSDGTVKVWDATPLEK